ncbi:sulfatase [Rubripirellula reticaptiva]|uniref:Arylsulfatase n=1 Tax=Rubripirellula reticaptiva TaxID=2528013 RepID=A0A5C6F9G0_9BACT|nr:sulfatase [Rubripirellula reticaptiva]TWU57190.1 Arylsulfatase precursor [Rubripirellula reticaptiva]
MMIRLHLIRLCVAFCFVSMACAAARGEGKPNILLVMLDDSGWTDFGCFGSEIQTPNIDALAAQGMTFTDCHAAAPNCSPSRVGMLTGRMPTRVGMYSYIPANHPMHLPDEEITIAEVLKPHGYATGHFGKWHVSKLDSDQPQPADQGFDYSLGTDNNALPSHRDPINFVRNGKAIGKVDGYSCQIVTDEANRWLASLPGDQPFFSCVWFHEPHNKIASPPELIEKYKKLYPQLNQKQATYYANIENVDLAVGQLLKKLDELDRAKDTFVFLTSDNGGMNPWSNQGLRGQKSLVYEGGQREPGILRWPGKVEPGSQCDDPVSHLDLLPTICEIAGAAKPNDRKLDGTSWLPILSGQPLVRVTPLMWFFYRVAPAAAMRRGDWVILGYLNDPIQQHSHALTKPDMPMIKTARLDRFELYNLKSDQQQTNDLSASELERLGRMRTELINLHREIVAEGPVWELEE